MTSNPIFASQQAEGYLDVIEVVEDSVLVEGWCVDKTSGIQSPTDIVFYRENRRIHPDMPVSLIERPDVIRALNCTQIPCGFSCRLPLHAFQSGAPINNLAVYARLADGGLYSIQGPAGRLCLEHIADLSETTDKKIHISELRGIALSITTRCNLRCEYCNIHSPFYVAEDMPENILDSIVADIKELNVREVHFGIMGEPTVAPLFFKTVESLLDHCLCSVASNFARVFTPAEVCTLAKFHTIEVSIDTLQADKLKQIRKNVDVRNILYNIIQIKSTACSHGLKGPKFSLSVVLHEENVMDLPELAGCCAALGIDSCQLLEMRPYQDEKITHLPRPVSRSRQATKAREQLQKAMHIFEEAGVSMSLDATVTKFLQQTDPLKELHCPAGMTKACLAPWSRLYIAPNGQVSPCCEFSSIGSISVHTPLREIVNSSALKRLRRELLTGHLTQGCERCCRASNCSLEYERHLVDTYSHEATRAETFGQPLNVKVDM